MRNFCNVVVVATLLSAPVACANNAPMTSAQRGKMVYDRWCSGCHGADPSLSGTYTLQQRYKGSVPAVLEQRTDLTPETVKLVVRNGLNLMPRTRKTEVSDADLDDLSVYLTQKKK